MNSNWKIDTLAVQGGYDPHEGEPRVAPIAQSTTYAHNNADDLALLFDLKKSGYIYTRIGNPSCDVLEKKMALLDRGAAALSLASGQAAIMTAVLNIAENGSHVLSSAKLYGGTTNLFSTTLKRFGIEVTYIDPLASLEELSAAIRPNTRCVYAETLANPALVVCDLKKFAKAAHARNIPLIVDNTFPTPALLRPIDHGADIVVYSSTKYLEGHGRALGGIIVDSGNFNWETGDFPGLTTPDASYHGLVYTRDFGNLAYIVKARVQLLRDMGAAMAPMNAWITTMGIETLHLRMERHSSNALAVARFLENDKRVSWVNYPGLNSSAEHERAKKYLPNGSSGVVAFGVRGGRAAGEKLQGQVRLARLVVHVCDTRTSLLHPASTTHRQLNDVELIAAGVTDDMIRFSVGIEHPDDIIADLDQALG